MPGTRIKARLRKDATEMGTQNAGGRFAPTPIAYPLAHGVLAMTSTQPPKTRPENPGVTAPGDDPARRPIDRIAPPGPGVGRPAKAPTDPNHSPHPPAGNPSRNDSRANTRQNEKQPPSRGAASG
jgi:hypothetical protein